MAASSPASSVLGVCPTSALELVPVKNDLSGCWDGSVKEELQAEHWAREVQGCRYGLSMLCMSRTAVGQGERPWPHLRSPALQLRLSC